MQSPIPTTPAETTFNLPEELALNVLDHLELRPSLLWVSHVSQRWRVLARSHPTFWKRVNVCNFDRADYASSAYSLAVEQLQSSRNPGLEVRLDVHDAHIWHDITCMSLDLDEKCPAERAKISFEFYSTLVQHVPRVSTLLLNSPQRALTMLCHRSLFIKLSPNLERLELSAHPYDSDNAPFIFQWSSLAQMPRLHSLRLVDVDATPISTGQYALSLPCGGLKELVWRRPGARHTAVQPSVLEELLEWFPNLHTLELLRVSQPLIVSPDVLVARLALLRGLALSGGFMQQLDITRLSQVSRLRVHDASLSTIDQVLEHFISKQPPKSTEGVTQSAEPSLEIDLRSSGYGWDGCPLSFVELAPGGRKRDFEIVQSTWMPDVPAMASIAHRVTKLAVRIDDWSEMILALGGAPALEELIVRIGYSAALRTNCTMVRCPRLTSFTLQDGLGNAREFPIVVSRDAVIDLVVRTFAPELLGKIDIQVDGLPLDGPLHELQARVRSHNVSQSNAPEVTSLG